MSLPPVCSFNGGAGSLCGLVASLQPNPGALKSIICIPDARVKGTIFKGPQAQLDILAVAQRKSGKRRLLSCFCGGAFWLQVSGLCGLTRPNLCLYVNAPFADDPELEMLIVCDCSVTFPYG